MQTAVEIVQTLDSVQAVSLLKRLNQIIFGAVTYQEIQDHLPAGIDELKLLENLDVQAKKQYLDPKTSVELSRQLLMEFARDEALAPVVIKAWDDIREDDSLFIETIIALGLIANLTLFMATTDLEFTVGQLRIKKPPAPPALVKAVLNPLSIFVGKAQAAG